MPLQEELLKQSLRNGVLKEDRSRGILQRVRDRFLKPAKPTWAPDSPYFELNRETGFYELRALPDKSEIIMGRGENVDIFVKDEEEKVSRRHLKIKKVGTLYSIEPFDGIVFVNGKDLRPDPRRREERRAVTFMEPGAKIGLIGEVEFIFRKNR